MRIKLLSDIHLEFHKDGGKSFVNSLDNNCDVLIIAGDLCTSREIEASLTLLSNRFKSSSILYVLGNHDYYHCKSKLLLLSMVRDVTKSLPNVELLENDIAEIDGQRFLGTTLWFDHDGIPDKLDAHMNDFNYISGIYDWISHASKDAIQFLESNIRLNDIVITHHLPHFQCINKAYIGSSLNRFFVNYKAEYVAKSGLAKFWLFGHTHTKCNTIINGTRFICNPFGYVGYEDVDLCNTNLILEV